MLKFHKKFIILILAGMFLASGLFGCSDNYYYVVTWDPPVENEDGTPITNLAGYRFYLNDELMAELSEDEITYAFSAGKHFKKEVTAFNTAGNESRRGGCVLER